MLVQRGDRIVDVDGTGESLRDRLKSSSVLAITLERAGFRPQTLAASDGNAPPERAGSQTAHPAYWPGKEYIITLDKSQGTTFGIDVDVTDGRTIIVDAIKGGLAEKWNLAHPEQQVREGDCIVEINSVRHNVRRMLAECKKNRMLSIRLLPQEAAFPSQDFSAELSCPLLEVQDIYTIDDGEACFPPNVVSALQPEEKQLLLMIDYSMAEGAKSSVCLLEETRERRDALMECLTVLCVVARQILKR